MRIPFTQTKEYLGWHNAVGTRTHFLELYEKSADSIDFQIDDEEEKVKTATIASIVLNLRIGKVLYIPYGPVLSANLSQNEKDTIIHKIHELGVKEDCVFVRLEDENKKLAKTKHIVKPSKKTFAKEGIFQPRMEWWLDLQESEEELLNRIHKDHRYSIRRAQKENIECVIIKENLLEYFDVFWNVLRETGERDGFTLYEEGYYKQIFGAHSGDLKKFLVLTKHDGKYMSAALIVVSDRVSNLVFAGSVSEKRELGFNHLMQWEAIKESKREGCDIYNFGGIYEDGYGKKTLEGVTKFKKRFGGYAKFHGDFVDIPIKKFKYLIYILRKMI